MDHFTFLPESLKKSLEKLKLTKPTEVQEKVIPLAVEGKDVIVSAPTGTGKTLAFCVPILNKLLNKDNKSTVLIITPTREIASQIITVLDSLLYNNMEIKPVLLIGGTDINKQFFRLKNKPKLIVGTPGRINDHLKRKSLSLQETDFVVLDEMDRMLDMGFDVQIEQIFSFIKKEKQVMMLSATIPNKILAVAKKYLTDPEKITINAADIVNTDIKQEFIHLNREEKYDTLRDELNKRDGTVIIFAKTRINTMDLAKKLNSDGYKVRALHGQLRQHQRDKVINMFRREAFNIVVATDVAARGIDVPHIKHVINYNLPTNPEDYVHRVGRTGRAGQEGHSLCFVSPDERKEWYSLEIFLDPSKKPQRSQSRKTGNRNNRKPSFSRERRSFGNRDDRRPNAFGSNRRSNDRKSDSFGDNRRSDDRKSNDRKSDSFGADRRSDDRRSSSFGDNRRSDRSNDRRSSSFGDNRRSDRSNDRRSGSFGDNRKSSSKNSNFSKKPQNNSSKESKNNSDSKKSEE